jgi:Domain of Unknown Function (DUF1080).
VTDPAFTAVAAPPPGAVVLFDGTNLDAWTARRGGGPARWPLTEDGAMVADGGDIMTRARFADFYLHLEFACNDTPPHVTGQGRGNSGVFLQGRYEIQVLDSWRAAEEPPRDPPGKGDCGAIYNHAAPLVNACLPPEVWQSYDIVFRAPRFGAAGEKVEGARITAFQNGRVIHNNVEVPRQTGGALDEDYAQPGPLLLQDHGNPVRFRNIWILPLPSAGADHY